MMMLDDKGLVNADLIKTTFNGMPIPDKFNDHSLTSRSFDPSTLLLTDEEKKSVDQKSNKFGAFAKSLANEATGGLVDTIDTKYLPVKFDKYFSENNVDCISVGNGTELGHLNMLQECKIEYLNYKVPIISNSGKIKDSNIYKVLIGGANCILIENLNDNTLNTIKKGLSSINIKSIECLNDEKIEIYKYT